MITERFVASNGFRRNSRSKKRLVFLCCLVVCLFFLYNGRRVHELIMRQERSLTELHYVGENDVELRNRPFLTSKLKASSIGHAQWPCSPRTNIVFIKTHRTGSSTVTNMLNRYGDVRNLTFVLPKKGKYRLGWPYQFTSASYSPLRGRKANILCNHARYNRRELELIMPSNTDYITILRDPANQFPSVFNEFKLGHILRINASDSLGEFLSNPWFYLERALRNERISAVDFHRLQVARNGMLFDLGLSPDDQDIRDNIRTYIKRLDKELSLVMLTEYFTESLVLLKYLMSWELDDVVHIALNVRRHRSLTKNIFKPHKQKIYDWNYGDVLLYRYFNNSFWKKVRKYGDDFHRNVKLLEQKVLYWEDTCSAVNRERYRTVHTLWMCTRLLTNETTYVEYLQRKQSEALN